MILNGRVVPLPSYRAAMIPRAVKRLCADYTAIETLCQNKESGTDIADAVLRHLEQHRRTFEVVWLHKFIYENIPFCITMKGDVLWTSKSSSSINIMQLVFSFILFFLLSQKSYHSEDNTSAVIINMSFIYLELFVMDPSKILYITASAICT